jgi:dTDP-glucose 4,6-dehydratase
MDCGKIARELGFTPLVSLDAGLACTFEWYVANERWWRRMLVRSAS